MKDYVVGGEKDTKGFKKISWFLITNLTKKAKKSLAKRELYLLHYLDKTTNTSSDLIQKLILAMEKGTYLVPHRHLLSKTETSICIQGKVAVVVFDDKGKLIDYCAIGPKEKDLGTIIDTKKYHSSIALEKDSVLLEFTEGPYDAKTHKQRASWAPADGSKQGEKWVQHVKEELRNLK